MAYSDPLADRIRDLFDTQKVAFVEKRMMGGLCFMVDGKMCLGVMGEELMARIGPEPYEACLLLPGARAMDFTGRPMIGFLFVDADGIDLDRDLECWVRRCLEFNPKAKASKKSARP